MKTTKKQFDIFIKESKKWINIFGLKEWSVHFAWEVPIENCVLAWSNHNFTAKSSYLILSKEWNTS